MTLLLPSPVCSDVAAVLLRSALSLRQFDVGQWELVFPGPVPLRVSARLADAFLLFDAPTPATLELAHAPQWLRWNSSLLGSAKIVLTANPWRVRIRAELALDDDANLEARVGDSLLGLRAACELLSRDGAGVKAAPPQDSSVGLSASSPRLFSLLREKGRNFHRAVGAACVARFAGARRHLPRAARRGFRGGARFG